MTSVESESPSVDVVVIVQEDAEEDQEEQTKNLIDHVDDDDYDNSKEVSTTTVLVLDCQQFGSSLLPHSSHNDTAGLHTNEADNSSGLESSATLDDEKEGHFNGKSLSVITNECLEEVETEITTTCQQQQQPLLRRSNRDSNVS
jgi:hypothetical protein